jgi:hypothetical protein
MRRSIVQLLKETCMTKRVTENMLRRWASDEKVGYTTVLGGLCVNFHAESPAVSLLVRLEENGRVVRISTLTDATYPLEWSDQLLSLINDYHHQHRWPTVRLMTEESGCSVRGEHYISAAGGLYQWQLNPMITNVFVSWVCFVEWLHDHMEALDADGFSFQRLNIFGNGLAPVYQLPKRR